MKSKLAHFPVTKTLDQFDTAFRPVVSERLSTAEWGTLALVGSGEYLPSMEPVDRLLQETLTGDARVVCLPTAAGTEGAERIR